MHHSWCIWRAKPQAPIVSPAIHLCRRLADWSPKNIQSCRTKITTFSNRKLSYTLIMLPSYFPSLWMWKTHISANSRFISLDWWVSHCQVSSESQGLKTVSRVSLRQWCVCEGPKCWTEVVFPVVAKGFEPRVLGQTYSPQQNNIFPPGSKGKSSSNIPDMWGYCMLVPRKVLKVAPHAVIS